MSEAFPRMRRVARPPLWVWLMDTFVRSDGTFVSRFLPHEPYWNGAIKKARSSGWIRRSNFGLAMVGDRRTSDRHNFMWDLTPKGEGVAAECAAKVTRYKQDVAVAGDEWRKEFAAWKEAGDGKERLRVSPPAEPL